MRRLAHALIPALIAAALAGAGCIDGTATIGDADPMGLAWVSPGTDDGGPLVAGEAVQLSVATANPDATIVHFAIDGAELAACDPRAPGEDCRLADLWRWTAPLPAGSHTLTAWFVDGSGARVEATQAVAVAGARSIADLEDDDAAAGDVDALAAAEPDANLTALAASRGSLDPSRPFHDVFGGISWAVQNQRVVLHAHTPVGSVAAVRSCMARYGASIRRWADHYHLSRASVVATALTESSCTNPAGSSDGLSSGPMQVTASTCAALTGLSRGTCRVRMHTQPDFSFHVGVMYMATSYQRAQHHRDPPKIAAAYNAGSIRKSYANRWHMVTTGNHIDRWVSAYNAYRAWETTRSAAIEIAPVEPTWDGAHVDDASQLPAQAAEGTTVFVGDFAARDGEFVTFTNGAWQP
jgi:hypothetical protein